MKKRVIIGAVILLVVLYAFRVYKVNSRVKVAKEDIIPFGTEREVGNGLSMRVDGYESMTKEEAEKRYAYDMGVTEEAKIILVKVKYLNKTNESRSVDTRPNSIEKTGYSTATEMEFYHICNSLGLEFELKGGKEKEIILPYILFKFQFKQSEWEKIEDKEFYISNSRYPVKTKWMLK